MINFDYQLKLTYLLISMQKFIFIFSFLLIANFSFAQVNLVPNPSFESYSTCPDGSSQLYKATPWFNPALGSPDYFNVCFDTTGW